MDSEWRPLAKFFSWKRPKQCLPSPLKVLTTNQGLVLLAFTLERSEFIRLTMKWVKGEGQKLGWPQSHTGRPALHTDWLSHGCANASCSPSPSLLLYSRPLLRLHVIGAELHTAGLGGEAGYSSEGLWSSHPLSWRELNSQQTWESWSYPSEHNLTHEDRSSLV